MGDAISFAGCFLEGGCCTAARELSPGGSCNICSRLSDPSSMVLQGPLRVGPLRCEDMWYPHVSPLCPQEKEGQMRKMLDVYLVRIVAGEAG